MKEKNDKLPLYLQLREEVRRKIENGEYAPGTAIPSEKQLADTHGMHRLSVRNALKALIREGLLKSIQGKGIYVCGSKKTETAEKRPILRSGRGAAVRDCVWDRAF